MILDLETRPKFTREDSLISLACDHVILDKVGDELVSCVKKPASDDFEDAEQKKRDAVCQNGITRLFCGTEGPDETEDSKSTGEDASSDCCDSFKIV